jgi:hypothetical protein
VRQVRFEYTEVDSLATVFSNQVVAMKCVVFSFAVASFVFASVAAAESNGTYVMDGGAYSINVEFVSQGLQIVEPNKTSLYASTGRGEYQFTNPTNGITYGLRVIDDSTIEAFKPGSAQPATTLKRTNAIALTVDEENPNYAKYQQLAEKYADLTQSDSDNVHVWAACGAAAIGWANMPADQAKGMASQSAALLKSIMTSAGSSPCPEVIPNDVW